MGGRGNARLGVKGRDMEVQGERWLRGWSVCCWGPCRQCSKWETSYVR